MTRLNYSIAVNRSDSLERSVRQLSAYYCAVASVFAAIRRSNFRPSNCPWCDRR